MEVDRKRSEHAKVTAYNYTRCLCVLTLFCQFLCSKKEKQTGNCPNLESFTKRKSGFEQSKGEKNLNWFRSGGIERYPLKEKRRTVIYDPHHPHTILFIHNSITRKNLLGFDYWQLYIKNISENKRKTYRYILIYE